MSAPSHSPSASEAATPSDGERNAQRTPRPKERSGVPAPGEDVMGGGVSQSAAPAGPDAAPAGLVAPATSSTAGGPADDPGGPRTGREHPVAPATGMVALKPAGAPEPPGPVQKGAAASAAHPSAQAAIHGLATPAPAEQGPAASAAHPSAQAAIHGLVVPAPAELVPVPAGGSQALKLGGTTMGPGLPAPSGRPPVAPATSRTVTGVAAAHDVRRTEPSQEEAASGPAPLVPPLREVPVPSSFGAFGDETFTLRIPLDGPFKVRKDTLLREFERAYFARLLERCEGNVARSAREAGLDRKHLYSILYRHGLL